MVFFFQFVYVVDYIDRFPYVEPSLHLWYEAYLVMVDDFSDVLLDSVGQYFIEYFCINVYKGDWSVILFLSCNLCGLGDRVTVASLKELGNVPSGSIFRTI